MRLSRRRLWLGTYLLAVLLCLVYPFTGSVFRDNDQAAFLRGAWELAHQRASFWHGTFYNYDKQWGAYLGLSLVYRLFPRLDPVFAGNLMQVVLISVAWLTLALRTGRSRRTPISLLAPILISPALILYAPYFGTSWLSLSFLLIAFYFFGQRNARWKTAAALISVAAAASCRGDVILALPALLLTQTSRSSFLALLKRPLPWLLLAAGLAPILFGKLIDTNATPNSNPLAFDIKAYAAVVGFGLTPACVIVFLWAVWAYLHFGFKGARFRFYYVLTAVSLIIPFSFYSFQLYTIRYFFLTLACALFGVSSNRCSVLFRSQIQHFLPAAAQIPVILVGLSIAPWVFGIDMPALWQLRLTVSNPTRFPTGDGHYPMGAYLAFARAALFDEHLLIDHNQRVWLAARSVDYEVCPDGTVPFRWSPMVNFLEFAATLQNKKPQIAGSGSVGCDAVYADLRSLSRRVDTDDTEAEKVFTHRVVVVSKEPESGEPIVRVQARQPATDEGQLFRSLRAFFDGRESLVYFAKPKEQNLLASNVNSELEAVAFSLGGSCIAVPPEGWRTESTSQMSFLRRSWPAAQPHFPARASLECSGREAGWAETALPPFLSVSRAFAVGIYGHPIAK